MPSMTSERPLPMLRAEGIHKRFGATEVLKGVSLSLARGEVIAVIGPSGSGKSTFLRCLNHLETIDRGRIDIEGDTLVSTDAAGHCRYAPETEIRRICRRMGMVFQHFNLFPHLTVLQNVIEAPLTVKRMRREAIIPKAEALLRKVGLLDKCDAYPARLSGGQKQRVAIARALAMEPDIMLFDEPTSALDPIATASIEELIADLKSKLTILIVTHNMQQAARVSDYTAFMYLGNLIEVGRTEEMFTKPKVEQTEAYITGRFG